MPRVKAGQIQLYVETHGAGYPLVLIRGLGSNADHWYCQLEAFSSRFQVVVFDNRGVARSDAPRGPFTIPAMADDTVGLMEAIGIDRAHILGISMGGMIAQEIALRHPDRLHGLILACTHCGGEYAVRPAEEVRNRLVSSLLSGTQEALACLFTEKTLREAPGVAKQYQEVSGRFPPETDVLLRQLEAIQGHNTWDRLPSIQAPTLVLTGSEDVLVPPVNSRILAERIPKARLRVIDGGAHQFMVEKPEAFNTIVLEFLGGLAAP